METSENILLSVNSKDQKYVNIHNKITPWAVHLFVCNHDEFACVLCASVRSCLRIVSCIHTSPENQSSRGQILLKIQWSRQKNLQFTRMGDVTISGR